MHILYSYLPIITFEEFYERPYPQAENVKRIHKQLYSHNSLKFLFRLE